MRASKWKKFSHAELSPSPRDLITKVFYYAAKPFTNGSVEPQTDDDEVPRDAEPSRQEPEMSENARTSQVPGTSSASKEGSQMPPVPEVISDAKEAYTQRKRSRSVESSKAEAKSFTHMLHHLPKNPYCEICQTAKWQNRSAVRANRLGPLPSEYGEEGTCDHWIARSERSKGLDGQSAALTYRDRSTDWISCKGRTTNSADLTYQALNH